MRFETEIKRLRVRLEGKIKHLRPRLRPRRKCRLLDRAKTDVPGVRTDALRDRTCRVETDTGTEKPKHWPQF